MVYPKTLIVARGEFEAAVLALRAQGYDRITIALPGSPLHKAKGLSPDRFLIRAWRSRRC